MKHLLWVMAGLAVFAGVAANRASTGEKTFPSRDVSPETPHPRAIKIDPDLDEQLPFYVGIGMDWYLRRAIFNLQTPVSGRDREFGMGRVTFDYMGPHPLYYSMFSFGNATSKFEPTSWRAVTINDQGSTEVMNPSQLAWHDSVSQAAAAYQDGYDKPTRWTSEDAFFEARPVRLNQDSCLNCHTSSAKGDLAAVIVYRMSRQEAEWTWTWEGQSVGTFVQSQYPGMFSPVEVSPILRPLTLPDPIYLHESVRRQFY